MSTQAETRFMLASPTDKLEVETDMLVLLNAVDWYSDQRFFIKGRPWIVCVSTCFDDIVEVTKKGALIDSGVNCFFSNCESFVKQASQVMTASFCWRAGTPQTSTGVRFTGCSIPNIADRDFSLLHRVATSMVKYGADMEMFRIYVPECIKERLPESLEPYRVSVRHPVSFENTMNSFKYYVPAPRLTDYRVGILPPELIYAMSVGCMPILVKHQVLDRYLKDLIDQQADSLSSLDDMVKAAVSGTLVVKVDQKISNFLVPVNDLAAKIYSAYGAWKK